MAQKIETELKRCDVFIAILSEHFRKSEWTDQETGYALSRSRTRRSKNKCLVMSLLVSPLPRAPHGFLKDFQALKLDRAHAEHACGKMVDIIEEKLGLIDFKKNRVISQFASSGSFRQAKMNLRELHKLKPFSLDQSRRIAQAALTNTQIHWPPENQPQVMRLLRDHFDGLDEKTKQQLLALSD
jgi:hypothetical protein